MKIVTVIGARPQFIKSAPFSRCIQAHTGICEILVHTGQHYAENMSEVFFQELEIPKPKYNLGIGSTSHGAQTGRMLERIEQVLMQEKPNWVMVYGDTNSTLSGALAAAKLHIPVAHVEAGLRSFNRRMPEEVNRILTDHISSALFAPTGTAVNNLNKEGVAPEQTHLVGDIMYEASIYFGARADQQSRILEQLGLRSKEYVLSTIHRAENTDDPGRLYEILDGLEIVARQLMVVLPLHPRTKNILLNSNRFHQYAKRILFIEPVGYLDMVMLEKNAKLIATDSGGVQKEAYFYRVPCVTLREETEWVELLETGWNRLVGAKRSKIVATIMTNLEARGTDAEIYGNGKTSAAIVQVLLNS